MVLIRFCFRNLRGGSKEVVADMRPIVSAIFATKFVISSVMANGGVYVSFVLDSLWRIEIYFVTGVTV